MLHRTPKDYDICTSARPEQVQGWFQRTVATGIRYGTVTVLTGSLAVEVGTFRQALSGKRGSKQIEMLKETDPREDVFNRDFTINGLLFDGEQILDYVGGRADLKQGIIRAIGDPVARLREDPLRLLRAIRLGCQLGFTIASGTLSAMAVHASWITRIAAERIREECHGILLSDRPAHGFRLVQRIGLLKFILPELDACYRFEQHNPHHNQDVFEHILTVVENTPPQLHLRWAALLHDIGKPLTFTRDERGIGHFYGHQLKSYDLAQKILTRLKVDQKLVRQVVLLVKEHMSKLKNPSNSTLRRLIHRVGSEHVLDLLDLQIADANRPGKEDDVQALQEVKQRIRAMLDADAPVGLKMLAINGDDLKTLGVPPSKALGRILSALLEKVMDSPDLNTREDLLALAEKMLRE